MLILQSSKLWSKSRFRQLIFPAFSLLTLSSVFAGIYFQSFIPYLIPFAIIFGYITIADFKKIFYLLWICIPLSIEVQLGGGFGTDLPSEPLIILLMLIFLFYIILYPQKINIDFIKHPIIQVLFIHLLWIAVCVIYSSLFYVSFKFLLAKLWYIITFVFLTSLLIKDLKDFKPLFWCIFIPALFVVVQTLFRQAGYGFTFADVNECVSPFFRNHVSYAAFLAVFYPFIWLANKWYQKGTFKYNLLRFSKLLFLIAIYFSYTRAGWLAILIAFGCYFIFKHKLIIHSLIAGLILLIGISYYSLKENKYLGFAPEYRTTIYHEQFMEHMSGTVNLEDLSTAERVYRWIAAIKMSGEKIITGYGPGNFVNFYKGHTVTKFTTYVSGNEEKSGVHNYFLMTLTDQGVIGLVIFIALCVIMLLQGQKIYHQTKTPQDKTYVMSILLSIIIILVFSMLNDLIEVDKIGSFFFMAIALLVNQHLKNRQPENPAA